MKILVTGKEGQVGQALQAAAAAFGVSVQACSRSELDITDAAGVQALIAGYAPDAVINAAAYTAVDLAEKEQEQAFSINRDGPANLASACANADIPLLHISTDFVFDGHKAEPYREIDICAPLSVYGQSKWEGERKVAAALSKHIILRTSWVFGGDKNFVVTMRKLAETRDSLSVVSDQRGGPTAAEDIARSLLVIARAAIAPDFANWGVYHYCGAPAVSWYEFACEILRDVPTVAVSPIPTADYPTPAKRPENSVLNCSKIKEVFDISQPDWMTALKP